MSSQRGEKEVKAAVQYGDLILGSIWSPFVSSTTVS